MLDDFLKSKVGWTKKFQRSALGAKKILAVQLFILGDLVFLDLDFSS